MRFYFTIIKYLQNLLLALGISLLVVMPPLIVFWPNGIPYELTNIMYAISHALLLFIMSIRPLADIWKGNPYIRPLVQLRKGTGVLAASIIISFMLSKIIIDPSGFFQAFFTTQYWSMTNLALLAHLADITGVILLITSNNFSKHLLGVWWKRVQKLSYVFFYTSALFVYLSYNDILVLNYMFIVTILTIIAWTLNRARRPIPIN